ncbi:hypothetical protein V500_10914 [Pseudogymnoascus sp. VKM F-4518 (FW-2643)]|nr:hypothetical protein V500_10914 [Pseudogymnoascus sp. VKM F-4518 (FW-2643)]
MFEEFYITAPRAKRMLPRADGLWDAFFGGRARELVHLLIVPVPIKLKKQSQKQAAASSAASAATTNLRSGSLDTRPSQRTAIAPQNPADATAATNNPRVTFSTLPVEIYPLIFDHLNDLADLTCMGLAMPYLWGITQRIIHQRYKAKLGEWAGEQIVCVGDQIPPGDYPPGLFSADEVERLNKEVYVWKNYKGEDRTSPRTLFNLTYPDGTLDKVGFTANAEASRAYYACLARFSRYPSIALRTKLLWIYTDRPDFTPRQEDWILRNLTTKEFVTAEGIALDKKFIRGPFIFGIGFGDAVVARTLWTSNGTPEFGRQFGRGVWAGHRFDITTRSRHDEATKDEEWRDVSAEVKGEIAGIGESKFGRNWVDVCHFHRRFEEVDEDERDVVHELDVYMDEVNELSHLRRRW